MKYADASKFSPGGQRTILCSLVSLVLERLPFLKGKRLDLYPPLPMIDYITICLTLLLLKSFGMNVKLSLTSLYIAILTSLNFNV